MLKAFAPIFLLALLVVLPGTSRAMVGDNDWAKEDVGSQYPIPTEEEPGKNPDLGGLWMNGCWESRDPIEQYNPIFIPTRSPETPYEILPGVLDTDIGDKLAKLCNCRALVKCDTLLLTRMEARGEKRQRVITQVIDVTPETPFRLIP